MLSIKVVYQYWHTSNICGSSRTRTVNPDAIPAGMQAGEHSYHTLTTTINVD